jgi:hypothetical protein
MMAALINSAMSTRTPENEPGLSLATTATDAEAL